jgi:hypothetical protein
MARTRFENHAVEISTASDQATVSLTFRRNQARAFQPDQAFTSLGFALEKPRHVWNFE